MLKKIELKNSTILFVGIILLVSGLFIGFSDYLKAKKNKVYSEINILLYESETPKVIESDEEIDININDETDNQDENNEEQNNQEDNNEIAKRPSYNYNYIGTIEIPKLNLKAGFLDINSRYNNVDYNVTVIKGSTFPDIENNNLILAAHSGNCSVCYFKTLYKLTEGDIAYISYNNVKYQYRIVNIYEVEKTGKVAIYRDNTKNTLTLITCTRNSDTKQTVYILELYNKQNI